MEAPTSFGTKDADCPICLERLPKIRSPATTATTLEAADDDNEILDIAKLVKCGHTFHQSCLNEHDETGRNRVCPLCRADLLTTNTDTGDEEILDWTTNRGGMEVVSNESHNNV